MGTIAPTSAHGKFELNFHIDNKLLDGRWSNNGWLVELPDPISKLAWDNAAYVSPATAEMLKVKDGEILELDVNGRKLRMPAMVAPGQTDMGVGVTVASAQSTGANDAPTSLVPKEARGVTVEERFGVKLDLDTPFIDHTGKAVTLGDYFQDGKPVLITFNWYNCKTLCSVQLNHLLDTFKAMRASGPRG